MAVLKIPDTVFFCDIHKALHSRKIKGVAGIFFYNINQLDIHSFCADGSIQRRSKCRCQQCIHAVLCGIFDIFTQNRKIFICPDRNIMTFRQAIVMEPVGI